MQKSDTASGGGLVAPMNLRVRAAQATFDAFINRPLEWGRYDCGRLAGHLLRGMGHSPRLTRFGRYSTAAGALRAMKRQGFADLPDVLDSMGLERVPLAMTLPADLIGVPGDGMTALCVLVGNGKALAFADDLVCRVGTLRDLGAATAWRVPCLK